MSFVFFITTLLTTFHAQADQPTSPTNNEDKKAQTEVYMAVARAKAEKMCKGVFPMAEDQDVTWAQTEPRYFWKRWNQRLELIDAFFKELTTKIKDENWELDEQTSNKFSCSSMVWIDLQTDLAKEALKSPSCFPTLEGNVLKFAQDYRVCEPVYLSMETVLDRVINKSYQSYSKLAQDLIFKDSKQKQSSDQHLTRDFQVNELLTSLMFKMLNGLSQQIRQYRMMYFSPGNLAKIFSGVKENTNDYDDASMYFSNSFAMMQQVREAAQTKITPFSMVESTKTETKEQSPWHSFGSLFQEAREQKDPNVLDIQFAKALPASMEDAWEDPNLDRLDDSILKGLTLSSIKQSAFQLWGDILWNYGSGYFQAWQRRAPDSALTPEQRTTGKTYYLGEYRSEYDVAFQAFCSYSGEFGKLCKETKITLDHGITMPLRQYVVQIFDEFAAQQDLYGNKTEDERINKRSNPAVHYASHMKAFNFYVQEQQTQCHAIYKTIQKDKAAWESTSHIVDYGTVAVDQEYSMDRTNIERQLGDAEITKFKDRYQKIIQGKIGNTLQDEELAETVHYEGYEDDLMNCARNNETWNTISAGQAIAAQDRIRATQLKVLAKSIQRNVTLMKPGHRKVDAHEAIAEMIQYQPMAILDFLITHPSQDYAIVIGKHIHQFAVDKKWDVIGRRVFFAFSLIVLAAAVVLSFGTAAPEAAVLVGYLSTYMLMYSLLVSMPQNMIRQRKENELTKESLSIGSYWSFSNMLERQKQGADALHSMQVWYWVQVGLAPLAFIGPVRNAIQQANAERLLLQARTYLSEGASIQAWEKLYAQMQKNPRIVFEQPNAGTVGGKTPYANMPVQGIKIENLAYKIERAKAIKDILRKNSDDIEGIDPWGPSRGTPNKPNNGPGGGGTDVLAPAKPSTSSSLIGNISGKVNAPISNPTILNQTIMSPGSSIITSLIQSITPTQQISTVQKNEEKQLIQINANHNYDKPDNRTNLQRALDIIFGEVSQYDQKVMQEICNLRNSNNTDVAIAAEAFIEEHDVKCAYAAITPRILDEITVGKSSLTLSQLKLIRKMITDYMDYGFDGKAVNVHVDITDSMNDRDSYSEIEANITARKFAIVQGQLPNKKGETHIDIIDPSHVHILKTSHVIKLSNELWIIPVGSSFFRDLVVPTMSSVQEFYGIFLNDTTDYQFLVDYLKNIEILIKNLTPRTEMRPRIGFVQEKTRDFTINIPKTFNGQILNQTNGTTPYRAPYIGDPITNPIYPFIPGLPLEPSGDPDELGPLSHQYIKQIQSNQNRKVEQWKALIISPSQKSQWELLQEALSGQVTMAHANALKEAKKACDAKDLPIELCRQVSSKVKSNRYAEMKKFSVDPTEFIKWAKTLKYMSKDDIIVKNPFTKNEIAQMYAIATKEFAEAIKKDKFAEANKAHMDEHMMHVDMYKDFIEAMGIDFEYYKLLVFMHDAGKYIPSSRVLELANGNFLMGRVVWHDQSTVEYLLNLGERIGIDPAKIEHLISDIIGHNDGSQIEGIFWNNNFPGYPLPRRLEGDLLALFDRFGQGNWTGARKILPNTVQEGFFEKVENAFFTNPQDTIEQLTIIYKRALERLNLREHDAEAASYLKQMFDYAVAAQQETINGYRHVEWSSNKSVSSITSNQNQTFRATNVQEFLQPPFQKALESSAHPTARFNAAGNDPWNPKKEEKKKWEDLYKIHHYEPSTLAKTEMDIRNGKLLKVEQYFHVCYLAVTGIGNIQQLAYEYVIKHGINCSGFTSVPSGSLPNLSWPVQNGGKPSEAAIAIQEGSPISITTFAQIVKDADKKTQEGALFQKWLDDLQKFLKDKLEIENVKPEALIQASYLPEFEDKKLKNTLVNIRLFNEQTDIEAFLKSFNPDPLQLKILMINGKIKGWASYETFYRTMKDKMGLYSINEIFSNPEIKNLHLTEYETWALIMGLQPILFLFQDYQWLQKNSGNVAAINERFKAHLLERQLQTIHDIMQNENGLLFYKELFSYFGKVGEWPSENQISEIQMNGIRPTVQENHLNFFDLIVKLKNDPKYIHDLNECLDTNCPEAAIFINGFEKYQKQQDNKKLRLFPTISMNDPRLFIDLMVSEMLDGLPATNNIYFKLTDKILTASKNMDGAHNISGLNMDPSISFIFEDAGRYYAIDTDIEKARYTLYSPNGFEVYRMSEENGHRIFYVRDQFPQIPEVDQKYLDLINENKAEEFVKKVLEADPEYQEFYDNVKAQFKSRRSALNTTTLNKLLYDAHRNGPRFDKTNYENFFMTYLHSYPDAAKLLLEVALKPDATKSRITSLCVEPMLAWEHGILSSVINSKMTAQKIDASVALDKDRTIFLYTIEPGKQIIISKKNPRVDYAGYVLANKILHFQLFNGSILVKIDGQEYFATEYRKAASMDIVLPNGRVIKDAKYNEAQEYAAKELERDPDSEQGIVEIKNSGVFDLHKSDQIKLFDFLMSVYMRNQTYNYFIQGKKYDRPVHLDQGPVTMNGLGRFGRDFRMVLLSADHALESPASEVPTFLWPPDMAIADPSYLIDSSITLALKQDFVQKVYDLLKPFLSQEQLANLLENWKHILDLQGHDETNLLTEENVPGGKYIQAPRTVETYLETINHLTKEEIKKWSKLIEEVENGTLLTANLDQILYVIDKLYAATSIKTRVEFLRQAIYSNLNNLYSFTDAGDYLESESWWASMQRFLDKNDMQEAADHIVEKRTFEDYTGDNLTITWHEKDKSLLIEAERKFRKVYTVEFHYIANIEDLRISPDGSFWIKGTDLAGNHAAFSFEDPQYKEKTKLEVEISKILGEKVYQQLTDELYDIFKETNVNINNYGPLMQHVYKRIWISYNLRDVLAVQMGQNVMTSESALRGNLADDLQLTPEQANRIISILENAKFFRDFSIQRLMDDIYVEISKPFTENGGGTADLNESELIAAVLTNENILKLPLQIKNDFYLLLKKINMEENKADGTTRRYKILSDLRMIISEQPASIDGKTQIISKLLENYINSLGTTTYSPLQEHIDAKIKSYFMHNMSEVKANDLEKIKALLEKNKNVVVEFDESTNSWTYSFFNVWNKLEKTYVLDLKSARKPKNKGNFYWVPLVTLKGARSNPSIYLELNLSADIISRVFDSEAHLLGLTDEEMESLDFFQLPITDILRLTMDVKKLNEALDNYYGNQQLNPKMSRYLGAFQNLLNKYAEHFHIERRIFSYGDMKSFFSSGQLKDFEEGRVYENIDFLSGSSSLMDVDFTNPIITRGEKTYPKILFVMDTDKTMPISNHDEPPVEFMINAGSKWKVEKIEKVAGINLVFMKLVK